MTPGKPPTAKEMGKSLAKDDGRMWFCPLPFVHVYNDNASRWRLCCRAKAFPHTVSDTTPEEHWDHPLMRAVREEMLTGQLDKTKLWCRKCLASEEAGLLSPRQQLVRGIVARRKWGREPRELRVAAAVAKGGALAEHERCLELKLRVFGNYCNLRCFMCAPVNSTSRQLELREIRDGFWMQEMHVPERPDLFEDEAHYQRFIESALRMLPKVRKIKITGGEPFLLKRHYEFLERVVATPHARHIRLAYDSNLTTFRLGNSNVIELFRKFRTVELSVSVDGVGERNNYIRYPAKFDEVVANIEKARAVPNVRVMVSCATSMLNAGDVHDVADFFEQRGLHARFNMCVVTRPTFVQARHLPDEVKEEYTRRIDASCYRDRFESVRRMLAQPRDPAEFEKGISYLRDLDAHRGTSFEALWPELAEAVAG